MKLKGQWGGRKNIRLEKNNFRTSLMVQWLRVHLPSAVDTGLTPAPGRLHICGATKPMSHNC